MLSFYISTWDLGLTTLFPALLALAGITMQVLIGGAIHYDQHASLVRIITWTGVSVAALMMASMFATYNPFVFTPQSIFGSIATLSVMDQRLFYIMMAIGEEQFFRGFLTKYFTDRFHGIGIIFSGAAFGIYHLAVYGSNMSALTFVFLAGTILSYVVYRTGLLSSVTIAHMINNYLAVAG